MSARSRACAGLALVVASYYWGEVRIRSAADGRELGRSRALLRRVVEPEKSRVVESVIESEPGRRPEEHVSTLARVAGGEFRASDGRFLDGAVRFDGEGWELSSWRYELRFKDGRRLTGHGSADAEGWRAEKTVLDKAGLPQVRIREELKAIGPEEYRRRRAELLGEAQPSRSAARNISP